jgi:hypothetical protein
MFRAAALDRKLPEKSAVTIEITWPPRPPAEEWMVLEDVDLVRVLGPSTDPEMLALEESLLHPIESHIFEFGTFKRQPEFGGVEATIDWLGSPVVVSLDADLDIDVAGNADTYRQLHAAKQHWLDLAHEAIIRSLYKSAQDWHENAQFEIDENAKLTESDFLSRIRLESVSVSQNGQFGFGFEDGDVFAGHWIFLRGTLSGGFEEGELHG